MGVSTKQGIWITVVVVGTIGAIYAIFGGLKMVAYTDSINGFGLLLGGLLVPVLALYGIGDGNILEGLSKVFANAPEKFNVVSREPSIGPGSRDAILPFSVLFTGLMVNQLYFWTMHQSIIQRALGAVSLKEAQKGLLYTGVLKLFIPVVIVLPGIIGFYYFGDQFYDSQDSIYPEVVKRVLPPWLTGFFVAVIMGAVLSTFNSALNSSATLFSLDLYKRFIRPDSSESNIVRIGRISSLILAVLAIAIAPFVASAPAGLYQLLQQLNGIFMIPMATVIIAAFFLPRVSAMGAKVGLLFGLAFYVITNFILKIDLHFVHIWGLEFVLNIAVMHLVSLVYPRKKEFKIIDVGAVPTIPWKYASWLGLTLIVVTLLIYLLLNIG